jgi:AmiR/NasT family two-component response regulator
MANPEAIWGPPAAAGIVERGSMPSWLALIWALPYGYGPEQGDPEETAGDSEPSQAQRVRLLIVEDEILTADYMQHLLVELGYEVCGHAVNTAAAIRLAESCRPDLVLMDVNLGRGGDGIVAAQQILERFGIRSLFVTAYGDRSTLGRAQAAAPAGIVLKPFDKQRLADALKSARRSDKLDG